MIQKQPALIGSAAPLVEGCRVRAVDGPCVDVTFICSWVSLEASIVVSSGIMAVCSVSFGTMENKIMINLVRNKV